MNPLYNFLLDLCNDILYVYEFSSEFFTVSCLPSVVDPCPHYCCCQFFSEASPMSPLSILNMIALDFLELCILTIFPALLVPSLSTYIQRIGVIGIPLCCHRIASMFCHPLGCAFSPFSLLLTIYLGCGHFLSDI